MQTFPQASTEPDTDGTTVGGLGQDHMISCGADGTVRLWNLLDGRQVGVVAGPSRFRAVDIVASTVAARDDDGRLWVLDADPSRGPAGDVDLSLANSDLRVVSHAATVLVEISTPTPVDPRAVQLTDDRRLWTVPGARPRLTLAATLPTTTDGALLVPRRIGAGTRHAFGVTQALSPRTRQPNELVFVLRLTFVVPGSAAEQIATLRIPHVAEPRS